MRGETPESREFDWMEPFKAPSMRAVINVGVMTPQQRAEVMARGVPMGVTNMERFLEQGVRTSQTQAKRASKPRGDEELQGIVRGLAKHSETAKELWPALIGELDAAGCDPKENAVDGDMRRWRITYVDGKGCNRHVSFDTFQRRLGESRKPE